MDSILKVGNLCTGCGLCQDICGTNAITIKNNEYGFLMPYIDSSKCVRCGLCLANCPSVTFKKNSKQDFCYAVSTEFSHDCSSGGAFEYLALFAITNGYTVFGAAFDEKLVLRHIGVDNSQQLKPLLKSKYLQSNCTGTFNSIHNLLKKGKKVLFCGTPCQVSAIKNVFCNKYRNQLILIDVICHGVTSQSMFDESIKNEEKKRKIKIKSFSFRSDWRYKFGHTFEYEYIKRNKKHIHHGFSFEFPYYQAFKSGELYRPSCYNCKYTSIDRVGDITLGDFWEISKIDNSLEEGQTSAMIINNDYGLKFINDSKVCTNKIFGIDCLIETNYSLTHCCIYNEQKRAKIWRDYQTHGIDYVYEKYYTVPKRRYQSIKNRMPYWLYNKLKKVLKS